MINRKLRQSLAPLALLIIAMLALAAPASAATKTVTLNNGADTGIRSGSPTSNFCADTTASLGRAGASSIGRFLSQFDLSGAGIPPEAIVTSATFNGNISATFDGGTYDYAIYANDASWDACVVTWNTRPAAATAYDTQALTGTGHYIWDITALAQGWVDGDIANNGIMLRAADESSSTTGKTIDTTDNATSGNRPILTINYVYSAPTVTTSAATGVSMDKNGLGAGTFHGAVSSFGGDSSADCSFEYGTSVSYGSQTTPVTEGSTGSFTASFPTNLTPGVTYHYRAICSNADNTGNGSDQTFSYILPTLTTNAATNVSQQFDGTTTATLNGNVTSMGSFSSLYAGFGYGETCCGTNTATQSITGTGAYSTIITGFIENTTYSFRARSPMPNGGSEATGSTLTFNAAPAPISVMPLIASLMIVVLFFLGGLHIINHPPENNAEWVGIVVVVGIALIVVAVTFGVAFPNFGGGG